MLWLIRPERCLCSLLFHFENVLYRHAYSCIYVLRAQVTMNAMFIHKWTYRYAYMFTQCKPHMHSCTLTHSHLCPPNSNLCYLYTHWSMVMHPSSKTLKENWVFPYPHLHQKPSIADGHTSVSLSQFFKSSLQWLPILGCYFWGIGDYHRNLLCLSLSTMN